MFFIKDIYGGVFMTIHVVQPGDTLFSIALQYGVSAERISVTNEIPLDIPLVVGQTVVILFPELTHTVRPGETIFEIADIYGISLNEIYRNNINLRGLPEIYPGQSLVIRYSDTPTYPLSVNGYAYPFVNFGLLRQTLPYNTYLAPFTYGITPSGALVPLNDEELLAAANDYGTAPLMHLSTLTEDGNFDSGLADIILNNAESRENLAQNIVRTIDEKGYAGLDIDFEFIPAASSAAYADFIAYMKSLLSAEGKIVIAALAPKTSPAQRGLLYEGHDYELIGAAADFVLLMTYEWGYTYGPPLAVAPIPNVRRVLDYAVTVIPREKIYLGIPNYGYDWQLPFVQGESRAQSISNMRAVEIAREFGASIDYDGEAQSPYFFYTANDGTAHEVWFEDARSIRAKLSLVTEYSLYGAGYWNLMRPFPQNWLVLNSMFNLRRI